MREIEVEHNKKVKVPNHLYNDIYNFVYRMVNQNMDFVFIIDGGEGVGKSYFSRGISRVISAIISNLTKEKHYFGVDDIHFDLDEYLRSSFSGGFFKINLLDESRKVANKLRSTGRESVRFTNYLSECRSKQQVHIILLPAFHDLVKYLVNWRCVFIIHLDKMYKSVNVDNEEIMEMKRGFFRVFSDKKRIRDAYDHPYSYPRYPDYNGRWNNEDVFTSEELRLYNEKKEHYMGLKYIVDDDNVDNNEDDGYFDKLNDYKEFEKAKLEALKN